MRLPPTGLGAREEAAVRRERLRLSDSSGGYAAFSVKVTS